MGSFFGDDADLDVEEKKDNNSSDPNSGSIANDNTLDEDSFSIYEYEAQNEKDSNVKEFDNKPKHYNRDDEELKYLQDMVKDLQEQHFSLAFSVSSAQEQNKKLMGNFEEIQNIMIEVQKSISRIGGESKVNDLINIDYEEIVNRVQKQTAKTIKGNDTNIEEKLNESLKKRFKFLYWVIAGLFILVLYFGYSSLQNNQNKNTSEPMKYKTNLMPNTPVYCDGLDKPFMSNRGEIEGKLLNGKIYLQIPHNNRVLDCYINLKDIR
jgi:hypothetical protein